MILLDAYALIALLSDEPAAEAVGDILRNEPRVGMTSVNLIEVLDHLIRRRQIGDEEVRDKVRPLLEGPLSVLGVGLGQSFVAASMRGRHYRRGDSALSLADCVLLAEATEGWTIATADRALVRAAHREGIAVRELPGATTPAG